MTFQRPPQVGAGRASRGSAQKVLEGQANRLAQQDGYSFNGNRQRETNT